MFSVVRDLLSSQNSTSIILTSKAIDKPASVKAGDTYSIRYQITNNGNENLMLTRTGSADRGFRFHFDTPDGKDIRLLPGESLVFSAFVAIPERIFDSFKHNFTLILNPTTEDGTPRMP
jgi:hypothetical protein